MKKLSEEIDQAIDQTLAALRQSEPPAGIEQRLLHAVRERTAAASPRPATHLAGKWQWAIGIATTAAVFLVFSLLAFSIHRKAHDTADTITPPVPARAKPPLIQPAIARAPDSLPVVSVRKLKPPNRRLTSKLLCDCDPTAVAEAEAPSLPAPSLPLTAQEKVLLQIARHPDPIEIAELNPLQREAFISRERAEYKNFFRRPARPSQEQTSTDLPNGDQP